jgi:hypothetical protein
MKRASSWPWISTREAGKRMSLPSSKVAVNWRFPQRWNDPDRATAATCGYSSRRPFRPCWPESWGHTFSPRPWSDDRRLGLASYDRFFPNQDTLPKGGFGNLIALPLQKHPRERGHSVFVDEHWLPYPDQWAFLSVLGKIARSDAEGIASAAEHHGRVIAVRHPALAEDDGDYNEPWNVPPSRERREPPLSGPLPERVQLVLGNEIYIAREGMPPALRNRLQRLAAFQNPEFYRTQAMRLSTFGKPRVISCAEDHPLYIGLPRGCLDELLRLLSELNIESVGPRRAQSRSAAGRFVSRPVAAHAATRRGCSGCPRYRRSRGNHRLRQDRRCRVADCQARRQYPDPGAPPAIDGTVDGASVDFSRIVDQGHRSDWRWEKQGPTEPWTWP